MQDITFPLGTWAMHNQITVVCRDSLLSDSVVLCMKKIGPAGESFPVGRPVSAGVSEAAASAPLAVFSD